MYYSTKTRYRPLVHLSAPWPLPKQIPQQIHRRHHQTHCTLKRRLTRRLGMTPRRYEHLGPVECSTQAHRLLLREFIIQSRNIGGFFLVGVGFEVCQQGLECWAEARVRGFEGLEGV